jgi:hypothetical protein
MCEFLEGLFLREQRATKKPRGGHGGVQAREPAMAAFKAHWKSSVGRAGAPAAALPKPGAICRRLARAAMC